MPPPLPPASTPDPRPRRSHAWVPPVIALLLLLWLLATLGTVTGGRGGTGDSTGVGTGAVAGGSSTGGNDTGAGVRTGGGAGAAGAGPGGLAASDERAAGSDAGVADAAASSASVAEPDPAASADALAAAEGAPVPGVTPVPAAGPTRDRRLGFSSDLLASASDPDPTPVPRPVAPAAASAAASGAEGVGGAASFFGQVGRGNRFVYVIDRSSSMAGERFAAARFELIKSIRNLSDRASFQVVFYSNDFTVMPGRGLRRATVANQQRAVDWIRGVSTGGGTDPSAALQHVLARLRPTTLWLLSDGSFNADVLPQLQRLNPGGKVQINTIAFYNRGGETLLKAIANANDGDYRYVGP